MKHLDRYRGCLLGGAAGDALGYPVEFLSLTDIQSSMGPQVSQAIPCKTVWRRSLMILR